jgi:deoxyguanosine kinase
MGLKNIFISLGSNKGNKQQHIVSALGFVEESMGKIVSCSHLYSTESWGANKMQSFLNMAIEIETKKSATQLLTMIEEYTSKKMRDCDSQVYEDRTIDIDILFYGKEVITEKYLCVPHPLMHLRDFCVVPMFEMSADFEHPVLKLSMRDLYYEINEHKNLVVVVPNHELLNMMKR